MNIVVYKGEFAYDVVNLFMYNTVHFLEKKAHNVIIIDTYASDGVTQLVEVFNTKIVDLVISFGMANNPILDDGRPLYDAANTTLLAVYVDHPAYHINTLTENIKNFLCCFNDKEHVNYVSDILPNHHKIAFFLPQGGLKKDIEEDSQIQHYEEYKKNKSIDIVFSGTFLEEVDKPWTNNQEYPAKLIDEVIELFLDDDYLSIQGAFKIIFEKYKIKFSAIGKVQLANIYKIVQNYIRYYSRVLLMKELALSGLSVTICGNGWENFAKEHKNINYIGPLDIKDNLELINKAKVLINVTPTLRNGSHERVFTGMLNHTVIFTDKSSYYDEYFEDEKSILYYSFKSLNKDIARLKNILKDSEKLYNISKNAYEIANENHTWENRVDTILEMVALSKSMDK
ncbi:hypothetical protein AAW30_01141 [Arcobacter porcinus]|uniref:glycosyltransferase family protein n=1 Tax=Arcobacter porcinus TaxID=1935204 RepID=UPI00082555E2|nr:glycosyltransferase [Arcobacter porcinus]OCL83067.1 hypothetical protein AAW30_01141 [Arcobacter porcinus]